MTMSDEELAALPERLRLAGGDIDLHAWIPTARGVIVSLLSEVIERRAEPSISTRSVMREANRARTTARYFVA